MRLSAILLSSLAVAGLSGCAAPQTQFVLSSAVARPSLVELSDVPFFPQEEFFCGPASLAMVLSWSGLAVTSDDLTDEVYTPGREGTLAPDIVAAARRHGRLAVEVRDLATLLAAIDAGYPAIVMQNLGLSWYPQWHFAVAIGYDLAGPQLVLHSGTEARRLTPMDAFERTWGRSDFWAIVVLPPDTPPSFADEATWLDAIVGFERAGEAGESLIAYRAFLARYPENRAARMGQANALLALKDYGNAERAYRQALQREPGMAQAWNNLAYALYFQGRQTEAVEAARQALATGGSGNENYNATLRDVSETPK